MSSALKKIRAFLSQLPLLLLLAGCLLPNRQSIEHTSSAPISEPSILISYEHDGNDSIDRFTGCLIGINTLSFVLYDNGRLVLFDDSQFMESTISQSAVEQLLAEIEATGFFSLRGDGDEFVSPPPAPNFVGESRQIITAKDKTFSFTTGQYKHVAEPIKDAIEVVKQYKPPSLTPYVPDKLYIWVYPIQNSTLPIYDPPIPPILEWSYESIPLDTLVFEPYSPSMIISGRYLQFLMQEVKTVPAYRMVKQNGQDYLIMTCPAFD